MLCDRKDCIHYRQYRIGCCPMFKERCKYVPKSPIRKKPRKQGKYLKYGLTPEQQQQLRRKQQWCCAICKAKPKRLVLDHDHATGKARGYLCGPCNHKLIGLEDKGFRERGITYLDNPPAQSL